MKILVSRFKATHLRKSALAQKGFTLIEIMIVLVILVGLMAMLGRSVTSKLDKARRQEAKIQMGELSKDIEQYNLDCGSYPATLDALLTNPGKDACPNWGPNPYYKGSKMPLDPWNNPYEYTTDGGKFTIKSMGKGRKEPISTDDE